MVEGKYPLAPIVLFWSVSTQNLKQTTLFKRKNMGNFIVIVLLIALLIWIIPACIAWSWGLFVPAIFGLPHLTWVQAFGMWILFGCLFAGSGNHSRKS